VGCASLRHRRGCRPLVRRSLQFIRQPLPLIGAGFQRSARLMRSSQGDAASATAGRSSVVTGISVQIIAAGRSHQHRLHFRKPEHASWQAAQAFDAQHPTPSLSDLPRIDDGADAIGVDEVKLGHVQHDGRGRARLRYLQQQWLQLHRREIDLTSQGNDDRTVPAPSRPAKRGRLALRNTDVTVCHRDTSHLFAERRLGQQPDLASPSRGASASTVPTDYLRSPGEAGSGGVRACRCRRAAELDDHVAVAVGAIRVQLAEAGEHAQ